MHRFSDTVHRIKLLQQPLQTVLKPWTGKQVDKRPHQTSHKAWFSHILFCYFRGSTLRQPWFPQESGNSTMTNRCFLLWLESNAYSFLIWTRIFMNKEYYLHISVTSISYPKYNVWSIYLHLGSLEGVNLNVGTNTSPIESLGKSPKVIKSTEFLSFIEMGNGFYEGAKNSISDNSLLT